MPPRNLYLVWVFRLSIPSIHVLSRKCRYLVRPVWLFHKPKVQNKGRIVFQLFSPFAFYGYGFGM